MYTHRTYTPPSGHTRRYEAFLGVDFSTDPSQVDGKRSPWAPNLLSDAGGFPEKRPGWETRWRLSGTIHGICSMSSGGVEHLFIHAGTKLYLVRDNVPAICYDALPDRASCAFVSKGRLWLICDGTYVVGTMENGSCTVKPVHREATVPCTVLSRDPTGGGKPFDAVNLLTPTRVNSFLGTAGATVYQLDTGFVEKGVTAMVNHRALLENVDYSVDYTLGRVTFVTAPGAPAKAGEDNVQITFEHLSEGYFHRIARCTVASSFGAGANDHIFLSGNPDYPNQDWHSALEDPAYFPDTGYAVIGGGQSAVMGYLRIGDALAILKEPSGDDSAVFLRTAEYRDELTGTVFPVRPGISGVGAASRGAILNLRDDPLFLSPSGVFAVASRAVSQEKTVQSRSGRVDARLALEPHLETAVAAEWGNYGVFCVNDHCYIADARKQTPTSVGFEYEWYHWDNIPARILRTVGQQLWFGTADGRVCVFKDASAGMNRYSDDGAAIVASWSTKADDDGDFLRKKNLPSRGSGVLIKPYTHSSIAVNIRTERDFGVEVKRARSDIFDFTELDFTRLSFSTADTPQVVPFSTRIFGYRTIRITVKNDAVNEGFGVFGILRRFTFGHAAGD